MSDFPVKIFHNPNCGTSRNVVAAVREAGHEPEIVEYLKTGWTADRLRSLLTAMDISARDILRAKGTPAADIGLLAPNVDEETIIRAMVEHPVLVNRPIVQTPNGAVLARPVERVFELLQSEPARC